MNQYKLPQDIGDRLLNYLVSKPFIEVQELIAQLQNLEIIKEEDKDIKK